MSEERFDPMREIARLGNTMGKVIEKGINQGINQVQSLTSPNVLKVDVYVYEDNVVVRTAPIDGEVVDGGDDVLRLLVKLHDLEPLRLVLILQVQLTARRRVLHVKLQRHRPLPARLTYALHPALSPVHRCMWCRPIGRHDLGCVPLSPAHLHAQARERPARLR